MSVCLISTFHDPKVNNSLVLIKKYIKKITQIFDYVSLAVTNATSPVIFSIFRENKIKYALTPANYGSKTRKEALKNGIDYNPDYFFHIDLDRLLFWLEKYPEELIKIINKIKKLKTNEYLVIGRTKKAWESHPNYQKIPEEKTNKYISKEINKKVDVTPGCYAFSNNLAKIIERYAKGEKSGVSDTEWLMIAKLYGKAKIKSINVNGLSYETYLVFGEERAKRNKGEYNFTREQMAEESIKMINKVKRNLLYRYLIP